MAYHLYSTEGIILSSTLAGESNRFFHIYTEELGLVGVWGQGVRKLESKLRYNMRDFSHVRIHLIRGRHLWRLTDVEKIDSFHDVVLSIEKRLVMGRIASLMKRLLEEGADPELFRFFVESVAYLETETFDDAQLRSFELLFVLRALSHLGYGMEAVPRELVEIFEWNNEVLESVKAQRSLLTRIANVSLQQTQM